MIDRKTDRRDFLRLAASLGLSFAVPGLDLKAAGRRGRERPKSLVIIWLEGGPSQLETWDPHPAGPIGGPTQAIATTVPDLVIASHFPRMAEQMHRLSVVRSLVSKEGDHARASHYVRTGYRPDSTVMHPSLGSIVTRELPAPGLEIPHFISMGHSERRSRGGYLGGRYDAFYVADPESGATTASRARDERHLRRVRNLDVVSEVFAKGRSRVFDETLYRDSLDAAVKMLTSDQLKAFDVSSETQTVRDQYGNNRFGRACLVARRLLELGVRVIEITQLNYDTHEDNFNRHRALAAELDPALASLIQELADRSLLESTVVLCLGEFGRTPRINAKDGRDHWPTGFSCLVGGGGLASGVVIGATDPTGELKEPESPVQVPDLYATVLHALGIDFKHNVITPIGRPMRLSEGTPIERLQV